MVSEYRFGAVFEDEELLEIERAMERQQFEEVLVDRRREREGETRRAEEVKNEYLRYHLDGLIRI